MGWRCMTGYPGKMIKSLCLVNRSAPALPLPLPPAAMPARLASAYLGRSKTQFLAEVKSGIWPEPWTRGRVAVWLRGGLDERLAEHGGIIASSGARIVRERLRRAHVD